MKKLNLSLLLIMSSLSCASVAQIEDVRLSWKPPTQRENGVAFTPEEVSYYMFWLGNLPMEEIKTPYTNRALTHGTYTYKVIVCDLNGLCSNPMTKTFTVKAKPKRPKYPSVKAL